MKTEMFVERLMRVQAERSFASLTDWLDRNCHPDLMPVWRELAKAMGLTEDGKMGVSDGSPVAELVRILVSAGTSAVVENFLAARILGLGPRMFRASPDLLEACEGIELRIPLSAYVQPFEDFAVEFPREYASKRGIGENREDPPLGVFLHRHPTKILTRVLFASGLSIVGAIGGEGGDTIEEKLSGSHDRVWEDGVAYEMPEEEMRVRDSCVRSVLNLCMLLVDKGCKSAGKSNPSFASRLAGRIAKGEKKGGKSDPRTEADRLRLLGLPEVYEFAQRVRVMRRTRSLPQGSPGGSHDPDRTVRTHWRRAHFRMQPHGPGNSLLKRILIQETQVNAPDDRDAAGFTLWI